MNSINSYSCPNCSRNSTLIYQALKQPLYSQVLLSDAKDPVKYQTKELGICYCPECVFGFLMQPLNSQELDILYSKLYTFRPSDISKSDVVFMKTISEHLKELQGVVNVLEVGCHDGYFLNMLSKLGLKCTGFEPSPSGKIGYQRYSGLKIYNEFFNPILCSDSYDLICLRMVLEHINDPISFLKSLKNVLKPGGYLYVEIPDLEYQITNLFFNDFHFEHCAYFTIKSAVEIIKKAGFYIYDQIKISNNILTLIFVENESLFNSAIYEEINNSNWTEFNSKNVSTFMKRLSYLKEKFWNIFNNSNAWAIWGAGAHSINTISFLGLTEDHVKFVVDSDQEKHNKFLPGCGFQVLSPESLRDKSVNVILICSKYSDEIKSIINKEYSHIEKKYTLFNNDVIELS
ncbi:C-methyltransferase [Candidatus Magnetobacterium bavaricum]|uniref:C-methyltransferase n=1 Tax=Candidatus Magnetobacterium bavaricum TaxID=29290 RepID=A0A0F3GJE2_9BACT|nr:C-methyltransferase [Candidatus Magnetobacterium bavaricum]